MLAQALAVGRNDARRFLPAMLQRVQTEVGKLLRFGMGVDCDDAALITKFVRSQQLAVSL